MHFRIELTLEVLGVIQEIALTDGRLSPKDFTLHYVPRFDCVLLGTKAYWPDGSLFGSYPERRELAAGEVFKFNFKIDDILR